MLLSVVIPAYNEEAGIQTTIDTIDAVLNQNGIQNELIFIDDGSSDRTWEIISANAQERDNIVAVKFSRNFGKEAAIFAGLKTASGDCVAVMDSDLQHPPETLVEMYKLLAHNEGIDVVEARKSSRGKESFAYKISAGLFYKILRGMSKIDLENASDFKLMSRKVVDELLSMPERQTFFRAMSSWVGFHTEYVYFDVPERQFGKTKWSLKSLVRYAVNSITSFTSLPLQIVTVIGIIFMIFALIVGVQTLVRYLMGRAVEGFTTVILLILLLGGCVLLSLGVIGYYIAKIYEEVKHRPQYIIGDIVGKK